MAGLQDNDTRDHINARTKRNKFRLIRADIDGPIAPLPRQTEQPSGGSCEPDKQGFQLQFRIHTTAALHVGVCADELLEQLTGAVKSDAFEVSFCGAQSSSMYPGAAKGSGKVA